jgi:hypothetical protein
MHSPSVLGTGVVMGRARSDLSNTQQENKSNHISTFQQGLDHIISPQQANLFKILTCQEDNPQPSYFLFSLVCLTVAGVPTLVAIGVTCCVGDVVNVSRPVRSHPKQQRWKGARFFDSFLPAEESEESPDHC